MATISAAGIGSGLDLNGLLEQIVAAERAPTENRLNLKEAKIQAELSAFGTLKSSVSSLQSSLGKLKNASTFLPNSVSISNQDVLTASASSIAEAGSYSVEVSSLAESHALASIAFTDMDDVVGTGTLTFSFGTTDYDPGTSFLAGDDTYNGFTQNSERSSQSITIDNTNNTVEGIRDAINNADIGVSASIVNDGSGYRLLLTSDQQGLDNSLQITVDEGGAPADNIDTTGLSALAFNSSATNVEQTQAASDAILSVNGLTITRESNTVTGAIHGVTLNLLDAEPGTKVKVNVSKDTGSVEKNITDFVNAYNELATSYRGLTAYNAETGESGILQGDATARNLINQIRREMGGVINSGSQYSALSSIGITTNRDGTLSLDSDTLKAAIDDDVQSVAGLFHLNGVTTDSHVSYKGSSISTQEGNYAVNISSLATQGQLSGQTITAPITIDGTNDTFSVNVDGVSSGTLTLTHNTYNDMVVLAQEIENRINASSNLQNVSAGVRVEYVNDHFEIRSLSYGSDSTVSILNTNASLGFTGSAIETAGTDVVGTIGGQPATGSGQLLTGTGAASGLSLEITGTTTGNRGSVNFTKGIAGSLDAMLSEFLASDGQFSSKTESLNSQITDINEQRTLLDKRIDALEARYKAQFAAMDVLVGQLQATGDYLEQQLASLPQITSGKN